MILFLLANLRAIIFNLYNIWVCSSGQNEANSYKSMSELSVETGNSMTENGGRTAPSTCSFCSMAVSSHKCILHSIDHFSGILPGLTAQASRRSRPVAPILYALIKILIYKLAVTKNFTPSLKMITKATMSFNPSE